MQNIKHQVSMILTAALYAMMLFTHSTTESAKISLQQSHMNFSSYSSTDGADLLSDHIANWITL